MSLNPISMAVPTATVAHQATQISAQAVQSGQPATNGTGSSTSPVFQITNSQSGNTRTDPVETLNKAQSAVADFISRCRDPESKEMGQLLQIQMDVQQAGMTIELMSKTVEHATSGTKTVLQTQA